MGINNAAKPDHIILAGTNPKRPVHGYSCKALLPYKQKPLVYYVSKASAESKMFNKQIIIGPKKDLENVLFEEFDKMKHFSYKIIQENEPGDAEQIVHNAIKALDYLESDSKYTFISGCDILGVTGADIKTICFDINQRLESDLKKNKPSDIYFTLGLQEEDLSFYKGLKSAMRPSPLVEGIYVRTGNFHMFNKETVVEKQEEVIELLKMRKIRQHVRHPIRFMKYANDKFGKEGFYFLGQNIINNNKIFGNPLIKLLLAPLPKYKITFSQGEKLLKRVLGLNLSLVVTKGSVDIDTDEEFESLTAK